MAKLATKRVLNVKDIRETTERKPRAERWEELISAAASVFYEKGYDAATLQDIALRVGILKGSLYYYIKTKADLRDHLLLEVHNESLAMIRALAQTEGSALTKLAAIIQGHLNYIVQNLEKTTIFQQQLMALEATERKRLFGGDSHRYRDVLLGVIELGQSEGTLLKTIDPKLAAQTMLSSMSSIHNWYRPSRQRPSTAIVDHMTALLLRGHASDEGMRALAKNKPGS